MEEQKKTEEAGKYLCDETVKEEAVKFAEETLDNELDSEANKEAIHNVINCLKGQSNLTVCRAMETIMFMVPIEMAPIVLTALEHGLSARVTNALRKALFGETEKTDE